MAETEVWARANSREAKLEVQGFTGWQHRQSAAVNWAAAEMGLRQGFRWELQGTLGGGEYEVAFWLTPPPPPLLI